MQFKKAFAAAVVVPGLIAMGGVSAANARQGDAAAAGESKQCKVTIDRSQGAGVYDVTRQVFEDGNCICYVYTGPKPQADSIETAITDLLNSKMCPDARVQMVAGSGAAAVAGAGVAGGAGLGGAAVVAPLVAGGAAAAAIAASDSDDGPNSP